MIPLRRRLGSAAAAVGCDEGTLGQGGRGSGRSVFVNCCCRYVIGEGGGVWGQMWAMDGSSSSSSSSGEEAAEREHLARMRAQAEAQAAAARAQAAAAAAAEAERAPQRTPLGVQVRSCEKRWANDAYRTAIGEIDAGKVSLVGIGGWPRNAMLLYADMCALGYGQAGVKPDMEEAERWWLQADSEGHRQAGSRLKNGVFNSMLHMDPTNDNQLDDGWLDDDTPPQPATEEC
jgi:hypothetical protein